MSHKLLPAQRISRGESGKAVGADLCADLPADYMDLLRRIRASHTGTRPKRIERRCANCGCVLSRSNPDKICRPCAGAEHAKLDIDPIWFALIENADEDRIEAVAKTIRGDAKVGASW